MKFGILLILFALAEYPKILSLHIQANKICTNVNTGVVNTGCGEVEVDIFTSVRKVVVTDVPLEGEQLVQQSYICPKQQLLHQTLHWCTIYGAVPVACDMGAGEIVVHACMRVLRVFTIFDKPGLSYKQRRMGIQY